VIKIGGKMQGTIIKGIAGFYYVKTEDSVIECKARGKFRHDELTPMVGDKVSISESNGKGVIETVFKRTSELIRPTVANVTQAFVIFSLKSPDINMDLLNKFLVLCEYNNLKTTVCLNKIDLIEEKEYKEIVEYISNLGYDVIYLNAKQGIGIDELEHRLQDNVTVFCGPSGAGKSTLLNKLSGIEHMITGEVSEKIKRGKHTTRHSELIDIEGGFLVDTPGFSNLDISFIPKEELQHCFPEFGDYKYDCRFTGCVHHKEPNCSVKIAVEDKKINSNRYDFYIKTLEEIDSGRNRRW
jgi:ribosome biogenesis GTPase